MPKFKLNWSPNKGDQPIYETLGISKDRIELFEEAIMSYMNDELVVEIGEGIVKLSKLAESNEELAYINYMLGCKVAEITTRQEIMSNLAKAGVQMKIVSKEEAKAIMLSEMYKKDNIVN